MNQAPNPRDLAGGVIIEDVSKRRIKLVPVSAVVLASLLQLDGNATLTAHGWPQGARITGLGTNLGMGEFVLMITREDFPIVPQGQNPERVIINFNARRAADAPGAEEQADEVADLVIARA